MKTEFVWKGKQDLVSHRGFFQKGKRMLKDGCEVAVWLGKGWQAPGGDSKPLRARSASGTAQLAAHNPSAWPNLTQQLPQLIQADTRSPGPLQPSGRTLAWRTEERGRVTLGKEEKSKSSSTGLDPQLQNWASPIVSPPPTHCQCSLPLNEQEAGFSEMGSTGGRPELGYASQSRCLKQVSVALVMF